MNEMAAAADKAQVSLFIRLERRFRGIYGENGKYLAVLIVHRLFSIETLKPEAIAYENHHEADIDKEILNLRDDMEVRRLVTDAVRVHAIVSHFRGYTAYEYTVAPLENITNLGIIIPGGQAPSPDVFIPMVVAFDEKTNQLSI